MPHYSAAASLTLAAALLLLPSTPATASRPDSDLQSRIDQVLETFPPGGVQSAPNRIAWDGGNVTLTLEDDGAGVRSIGSCPTGAHCVYDQANLHGSYMTFNTCTTQSVAPLGSPVLSIANARTVVVRAYNDAGAVGSVSANSSTNTSWNMTKIGC